ncbi:hypothetical protein BGW42_000109 [Actinomortierella wolfii]|nr:hypothetical protein BGW42_000109 [Actinomortierella wolfii]
MDSTVSRVASKTAQLSLRNPSVFPYEDVTDLLEEATKDMHVGQMVHIEPFSLYDAMCAIVIMDPKMDTGMILDDAAKPAPFDINAVPAPAEVIWIVDNILIGMTTWLSGHALAQTLFTSCHVLKLFDMEDDWKDPQEVADPTPRPFLTMILKSCTFAIVKSCHLVWKEMRKGQVYEEEDFFTNKFGISLYESYHTSHAFIMLETAEAWLVERGSDWIIGHYGADEGVKIIEALRVRILFSRIEAPKCSRFVEAVDSLTEVMQCLERIESSHALGVARPEAFDYTIHRKLVTNAPPRTIALYTFEETITHLRHHCEDLKAIGHAIRFPTSTSLVNFFFSFGARKPLPSAYPRSVLQTVLYDDKMIMGTVPLLNVLRNHIQEIVAPPSWIFEKFDKQQQQAVAAADAAASNAQSTRGLGESLDMDLAFENQPSRVLKRSSLAPIPESAGEQTTTTAESELDQIIGVVQSRVIQFLDRSLKPFTDTLQLMGHNTARQRRSLRKVILQWEELQEAAEQIDSDIHQVLEYMLLAEDENEGEESTAELTMPPFYFVSWVYDFKMRIMELMLLLGFELELYSEFEYPMIYGFCEHILASHAQHAQRIMSVQEKDMEAREKAAKASAADKKKKKNKNKKKKKKTGGSAAATAADDSASSPKATPAAAASPPASTSPAQVSPSTAATSSTPIKKPEIMEAIVSHQGMVYMHLQLTRSTFLTLAALTKAGHLTQTPAHLAIHGLNTIERLFMHRFKAFQYLGSPEPWSIEHYRNRLACDGLDAFDILRYAADANAKAKATIEQLQQLSPREARVELCEESYQQELKSLMRVCIGSKLAIESCMKDPRIKEQYRASLMGARKGPQKSAPATPLPPTRKVTFEWKYHPQWPVIQLA